jgi:hypothetical protein
MQQADSTHQGSLDRNAGCFSRDVRLKALKINLPVEEKIKNPPLLLFRAENEGFFLEQRGFEPLTLRLPA